MGPVRFVLPILVCFSLAVESAASDYRFEDLPVGNRAMILGGAFTALSNDPSGVYYNPAGLVDTSRANVSISASLYGMGQKRIEASEESSSQFRIIPGAIGGMYTFDWSQGEGRSPYACALSVLSPSAVQSESLTIQEERREQGFSIRRDVYDFSQSDRYQPLGGGGVRFVIGGRLLIGVERLRGSPSIAVYPTGYLDS